MPRIKESIKEDIQKAEKAARKSVLRPRRKRRVMNYEKLGINPEDIEERPTVEKTQWIKDEWGAQGEVFFDGIYYWLSFFKPKGETTWDVVPRALTKEEWEEYKIHPLSPTLTLKQQELETLVTEQPLSSTRRITKSTKHSKKKHLKKSPMKSGKTATHRGRGKSQ